MLWLCASCNSHYRSIDKIKKEYSLEEIHVCPDETKIISLLGNSAIGIMAPYLPDKKLRSVFVIKELDNAEGILTEQEKRYGVSESQAIYDRLGLEAKVPEVNFSDIGGAIKLKNWGKEVKAALDAGKKIKGAFLIGPTGSGKTWFVEAFAGEFGRTLVMLNLPLIMEMDNPIDKLLGVFAYLEKLTTKGGKFVLLADEFEKMVDVQNGSGIQKQFLGQLLTILNNLNGKNGYKIDVIVFATANNLSVILDNNPELLRYGRWSAKFFLNYPKKEEAINIYRLYARQYGAVQFLSDDGQQQLYAQVEMKWRNDNIQPLRSVYSPAEINALMERLASKYSAQKKVLTEEQIDEIIGLTIPIQKTASTGVGQQIKDAELGFEEC